MLISAFPPHLASHRCPHSLVHGTCGGLIGGGYYVVLRGAGESLSYVFMHLEAGSTLVRAGQTVATGQRLGLVGTTGDATGPHLHFEVRLRGAAVDPGTALG